MSSRELHHLRRATEAAAKLIRKPVIETQTQETEPQRRDNGLTASVQQPSQ